jgi:hypothetical protein
VYSFVMMEPCTEASPDQWYDLPILRPHPPFTLTGVPSVIPIDAILNAEHLPHACHFGSLSNPCIIDDESDTIIHNSHNPFLVHNIYFSRHQ